VWADRAAPGPNIGVFFYLNTKLLVPFCMKIDEKLSASGVEAGLCPQIPHQGLCPWTPLGRLCPRPSLQARAPHARHDPTPFGKSWICPCSSGHRRAHSELSAHPLYPQISMPMGKTHKRLMKYINASKDFQKEDLKERRNSLQQTAERRRRFTSEDEKDADGERLFPPPFNSALASAEAWRRTSFLSTLVTPSLPFIGLYLVASERILFKAKSALCLFSLQTDTVTRSFVLSLFQYCTQATWYYCN